MDVEIAQDIVQGTYERYEGAHIVRAAESWDQLPHPTQIIRDDETIDHAYERIML